MNLSWMIKMKLSDIRFKLDELIKDVVNLVSSYSRGFSQNDLVLIDSFLSRFDQIIEDRKKYRTEKEKPNLRMIEAIEATSLYLGKDDEHEKICWDFGNAPNRHVLITGQSGMGKTYFMQSLLYEFVKKGLSPIVFDYSGSFTKGQMEKTGFSKKIKDNIDIRFIKKEKININPFKRFKVPIDEGVFEIEEDWEIASRISTSIQQIYGFGEQQRSALFEGIKRGLEKYDEELTFPKLKEELLKLPKRYKRSVDSTLNKLTEFIYANPFQSNRKFSWEEIINTKGRVNILQFKGLPDKISRLIIEFMLWNAWYYMELYGNEKTPLIMLFDEAQNLNLVKGTPVNKILREGRKYGFCGIFAVQYLQGLSVDGKISLGQANLRAFFKPTKENEKDIVKLIDPNGNYKDILVDNLKDFASGDAFFTGALLNAEKGKYCKVKIASLKDRKDIVSSAHNKDIEEKKLENDENINTGSSVDNLSKTKENSESVNGINKEDITKEKIGYDIEEVTKDVSTASSVDNLSKIPKNNDSSNEIDNDDVTNDMNEEIETLDEPNVGRRKITDIDAYLEGLKN